MHNLLHIPPDAETLCCEDEDQALHGILPACLGSAIPLFA
jgi:hypothetical protein